ncbi:MAG: hypothetical protein ACK4K3_07905 [Aquabacterium sp.]
MPDRPPRPSPSPGQVILIHPEAPPKPPEGAPCNGCGVCCLAEPCPVGMIISRRRTGACHALVWRDDERRYRCGLLLSGIPEGVSAANIWPQGQKVGPAPQSMPLRWGRALWQRWLRRIISAGSGCDASLDVIRKDP